MSYGRLSSWVAEDSNLGRPGKSRMLSPPSSQPLCRHGWSRTIVFRVSDGCSPVEPRAFVAIWIFQGLRGPGRIRTDVPWLQARRSSRLSYRPIVETEGIEPPRLAAPVSETGASSDSATGAGSPPEKGSHLRLPGFNRALVCVSHLARRRRGCGDRTRIAGL